MKAIVKALNQFIMVSYDVIKNIAGAVMAVIIVIVTAGIISRYFFSNALAWSEELCCLLLIWLCYMSASLTTVSKEHVVADFLSATLPESLKKILQIVIRIGEVLFFAVVSYSVWKLIPSLTSVSAALKIARVWYYLPVLVFGAYMALAVVVDLLNDLVPGYDYFGQRKAERAKALAKEEQQENEAMMKSVDEFMNSEEVKN